MSDSADNTDECDEQSLDEINAEELASFDSREARCINGGGAF